MKIHHSLQIALAGTLACTSCREERSTPTTFAGAVEQVAVSAADTAAPPAPAVPHPIRTLPSTSPDTGAYLAVALHPDSGAATAHVRLRSLPLATSYDVLITGATGNTLSGYVQLGRCEREGPVVASLNTIGIDAAGRGRSAGDVRILLDSLRARPHVITLGGTGTIRLCGEIQAGTDDRSSSFNTSSMNAP